MEQTGQPGLAYQIFKDLRYMYRYAIVGGLSKQDPTAKLRFALNKPKPTPYPSITDPVSIGNLLLALRNYQGIKRSTSRFLYRLAPILFLRPGELRTLEWKAVDLDAATLVVPAFRTKSRHDHVVPLARQAVRLLRDVQKITGLGRYVFTSGKGPDEPLSKNPLQKIFRKIGYNIAPHGFRAMASTWLNEQGWRADVIERQLSHVGRDRNRYVYNRAEYLSERRKMMQAWADHLDSLEHKAKSFAARRHEASTGGTHASV
jgi:integrase